MNRRVQHTKGPNSVAHPPRVDTRVTGTQFNYYHVCHTKLWYFTHGIQMEQEADIVRLGKLTHEEHYTRDTSKDEFILEGIKIDRITPDGLIHEVKKSDKAEHAHVWQLKYYLWVLKQHGFGQLKGILEFPKQRKRVPISLCQEDEKQIVKKLEHIRQIAELPNPPKAKKIPYCRLCSYRELCWC